MGETHTKSTSKATLVAYLSTIELPDRVMDSSFVPYRLAASYLREKIAEAPALVELPSVGIVCGSGLSGLPEILDRDDDCQRGGATLVIPYSSIPGFPSRSCSDVGSVGEVVFGRLNSVPTVCFCGRFHSYEGYDMKTVVLPVCVMRCLSVKVCIITNAAGALNPRYNVGDLVAVSDHLALPLLAGKNPLVGPNDEELGPRFPPTSNAYPETLREAAKRAAEKLEMSDAFKADGTYCFVTGPQYESRAECRFLRSLGGDAVGMSTVPEVITAHYSNLQVLCLSLITNKVVTEEDSTSHDPAVSHVSHADVLQVVKRRSTQMQQLVKEIVCSVQDEVLPKLPPLRKISSVVAFAPAPVSSSNDSPQKIGNMKLHSKRPVGMGSSNVQHRRKSSDHDASRLWIGAALVAAAVSIGVVRSSSRIYTPC